MAAYPVREPKPGEFPFCFADSTDRRDTAYVKWWRDRSNYLFCGGKNQWLAAIHQYARGLFGNLILLSMPIFVVALVAAFCYTWLRNHPFACTLCMLVALIACHLGNFIQSQFVIESGSRPWSWWRWLSSWGGLLVLLAFALAADLVPYCVEGVRYLLPDSALGLEQFISYGAIVAASGGTMFRLIGSRAGLRRGVIRSALFLVSWGSVVFILIALIDFLYFGIPPYGWFLFVPFLAIAVAIGVIAVVCVMRFAARGGGECRGVGREQGWARALLLYVVFIGSAGASMAWMIRGGLEPYSIESRLAAQAVAEITRPLARLTKAIKWDAGEHDVKRDPATTALLNHLRTRNLDLDAEQHLTWAEDYASTPLPSVLSVFQNALVESWLAQTANTELFRNYAGEGIGEWGVLTPLRPNYHRHAVAYLEACGRLDQLGALEKQRLRDVVIESAIANLRPSLPSADAGKSEAKRALAKARWVDATLARLFPEGPSGADRIDEAQLQAILKSVSSIVASPDRAGMGALAQVSGDSLASMAFEATHARLYGLWLDDKPAAGQSSGGQATTADAKRVHPFDIQAIADLNGQANLLNEAIMESLGSAFVKLHDTGDCRNRDRVATVIEELGQVIGMSNMVAGHAPDRAEWNRVVALPMESLAMEAAGLPPLLEVPQSGWLRFPLGLRGDEQVQPFNLERQMLSVMRFNLAKAAGRLLTAAEASLASELTPDDPVTVSRRLLAQFVLAERAMRPAAARFTQAEVARAILGELAHPSTPTTRRFRENLNENEQVLVAVHKLKPSDAFMKAHGVLPSTIQRVLAARFFSATTRNCDSTIRHMGVGRFGDLSNLGTMVEEVAWQALCVKSTLLFALLLAFFLFGAVFVEPNVTSIHGFYRDSLAWAFFIAPEDARKRIPERNVKLSDLADYANGSTAPYPLINAACNLGHSGDESVRERNAKPFLFSPRWVGGVIGASRTPETHRLFLPTARLEAEDPRFTAASAMTISGAAASPLMGRYTSWALRLAMVLANIRLGYWIRFPRDAQADAADLERVCACEFNAIEIRRTNIGLANGSCSRGLVGIACSGGGIRSAALNFGITQSLFRNGVWPLADYLSTVSGGGYLGTAISVFMRTLASNTNVRSTNPPSAPAGPPSPSALSACDRHSALPWRVLRLWDEAIDFRSYLGLGTNWINISDGGHFENLGVYSLLQRRCEVILAGDGEADPEGMLDGLSRLLLLAEVDLGVHITFRDGDLQAIVDPDPTTGCHFAIARIEYPERGPSVSPLPDSEEGWLIYMRSSLTGDEDQVVTGYRAKSPAFPHESTADQFFTEEQFEAYRRLGEHIGTQSLTTILSKHVGDPSAPVDFCGLLRAVRKFYNRPRRPSPDKAYSGPSV